MLTFSLIFGLLISSSLQTRAVSGKHHGVGKNLFRGILSPEEKLQRVLPNVVAGNGKKFKHDDPVVNITALVV